MGLITGLICTLCNARYTEDEVPYTCPSCGLGGIVDVDYDYAAAAPRMTPEALAANPDGTHWRYLPVLPIEERGFEEIRPTLPVGPSPLFHLPRLAERLGLSAYLIKDDGRLPTGSFKDRASSVGALRALQQGHTEIACASTGNAASSLAGWSAHLGLRAYIFVPRSAPEAKVAQLRIFDATVLLVDGNYDVTWRLCQEATQALGWYNRNCAVNPYLVEGKKTAGLELGEQLGRQEPEGVDWVAVSVGDGCTVAGLWKGLAEMERFGHFAKAGRMPKILGVQARGACPIHDAWVRGDEDVRFGDSQTLADSINVGAPRNGVKALRAVRASGGAMITVSDGEILTAMVELGNVGGVFGEPAGVAALAGVRRALEQGVIQPGESVVHVVTGSGLKDVKAADRAAPAAQEVDANLPAVQKALLRATRARAAHMAASGLPSFGASTHGGGIRLPRKS